MSHADILLMAIGAAVIASILWYASVERRHFKSDERNPYRRYCLKCTQRQDHYGSRMASEHGWWETIGQIRDRDCSCHQYTGDGGKWLRD